MVDPDGRPLRLITVASAAHPDGAVVELGVDSADAAVGGAAQCTAGFDADGQVASLRVETTAAPAAPPLWFVELRESAARPPTVSLLAFTGRSPAGTLLEDSAAADAAVVSDDQLGAVRWYPGSGEVDQIYVQPQWRRRDIGTALILAAGTLAIARDWPRLWADGQRTELGERFRDTAAWRHRAADLTHLHPPMTPGER